MPSWKKLLVSGSDASLNSLNVATNVVAQSFTGSLLGTASFAISASHANFALTASQATSASYALTASYAINIVVSGAISNVDYIDFDTSASYTLAEGRLGWDSGEGTLQLGMAGGNVTYSTGEQLLQYVYNAETSSLSKGQVVFISGSQGNKISVRLADNRDDPTSAGTLGFVAETIASGSNGWVLTEGPLRKLNTSGLTAGSLLFLGSTPGTYTSSIPQAPSHSVRLGYVERVHPTVGSIYVKIDNGYEIGELHDVVDTTTTNSFGDLLIKSGSVWRTSRQLTGSYELTGSLSATSLTGSLFGTSSFASTASFVNPITTNAFVQGGNSFGTTAILGTNDLQSLVLETSGSTRLFISSSGNIGVGTTNPIQALDVNGSIRVSAIRSSGTNMDFLQDGGSATVLRIGGALVGTLYDSIPSSNEIRTSNNQNLRINARGSGSLFLQTVDTTRLTITGSNVGIGTTTPTTLLDVNGAGRIRDNISLADTTGNVQIGTTTNAGFRLDVNGTTRLQNNTEITGSLSISGSANIRGPVTASTLLVSGSGTQRVTVIGSGSAQPIFTVQGSQGELFSITDSLSGSLFSVNDISGLPILEVFSDGNTFMGDYTAPAAYTTRRIASTTAGVNVIYSLATSSYDGIFVDYTIRSGSLGRAGNFMAMWSGSSTDFTDNSINGFGTTTGFVFGASISGSNIIVSGSGSTAGWTVKTIIRGI